MRFYKGNYEHYLKAREEEARVLESKAKHQEQKVKQAARFIERFRAKASKARQAQSKIKLVKKIELVETFQNGKPSTSLFLRWREAAGTCFRSTAYPRASDP
jgi:ATP-binding cassette subfamily F protein 3